MPRRSVLALRPDAEISILMLNRRPLAVPARISRPSAGTFRFDRRFLEARVGPRRPPELRPHCRLADQFKKPFALPSGSFPGVRNVCAKTVTTPSSVSLLPASFSSRSQISASIDRRFANIEPQFHSGLRACSHSARRGPTREQNSRSIRSRQARRPWHCAPFVNGTNNHGRCTEAFTRRAQGAIEGQ